MKDKILQNEIDNFDKLHSEMLRGQDSNLRHPGYTYP